MKTFRKITAWAMALAISSTATAVTAFAEETETTTTEAVTTTLAEVVTTTTAPTENTTVVVDSARAQFGTVTVKVKDDTVTKEVSIKDSATGMSVELKGNTVNFDGSVIQTIDISNTELTDEQNAVLAGLLKVTSSVKVDTLNFSDNVTEVKSMAIGNAMAENLTMVFGKNIKTIADDLLGESTAKVTVKGYKGTAAETFAASKNYTFVALDEPAATTTETTPITTTTLDNTTTTTASLSTTTTASSSTSTTTTKKSTTTSKATTTKAGSSPKTGDSGVGAVAGILALSAVTGAIALRKKDNE
ncbi:MAG: hypothetical protein IKJ60_02945 [Ruminococcus sp.]|nr:hypothetical protein [Ruminococcus sp.]